MSESPDLTHAIQLHGATPTPMSLASLIELPAPTLEPVRVPPAFASLVYSCGRPSSRWPR